MSDYFGAANTVPASLQALLQQPSWLSEYRDQLDWRLAHLTLKRLDFEKDAVWTPEPQFAHMNRLITEFLKALPETMRTLYDPLRQG